MPLRPSIHTAIVQALSRNSAFINTDFEVATTDAPNQGSKVIITYRHGDAHFVAHFPSKPYIKDDGTKVYSIQLLFKPGQVNLTETSTTDGEYSLCNEIEKWLNRLHQDIVNVPLARKIIDAERRLEELYATIGIKDDAPLTSDDASSLIERIQELEAKLAQNIEKHESDTKLATQRIDILHQQVEALCMIVRSQTTHRGAIRALLGRILGWAAQPENQQLLKDAEKTITGLLTSGDE